MNVLLLGDSHTHGFYGQSLEALLKGAGHVVTRVGWVSATASSYLTGAYKSLRLGSTGDYDSQVKGKTFDVAIISLGTNEAAGVSTPAQAMAAVANIQKLAGTFTSPVVFWVGPPAFSANAAKTYNPAFAKLDLNSRAAMIWDAGSAAFGQLAIDPREVTRKYAPQKDIHLGPDGGSAWAGYVFQRAFGGIGTPVTTSGQTSSYAAANEAPKVADGSFPWIPLVVGGVVLLGTLGFLWARRRKAPSIALPSPAAAAVAIQSVGSGTFKRWSGR